MPLRQLTVDTQAILNNYHTLRSTQNKELLPILKANAYGIGAQTITRALLESPNPPPIIGVASIDEAETLRKVSNEFDILVLGFSLEDIEPLVQNGYLLAVSHPEHIDYIHQVTIKLEKNARIHLSVDTGMHRLGIKSSQAVDILCKIRSYPTINLEGIYSHFIGSNSTAFESLSKAQIEQFEQVVASFPKELNQPIWTHFENTFGNIFHPVPSTNMVRCGIGLYGPQINALPLSPALKLETQIIGCMNLNKGDTAGYYQAYKATEETTLGIIPLGYADGLPIDVSSIQVEIQDKLFNLVGTASMDACWVDLGSFKPKLSDKVILFDQKPGSIDTFQRQSKRSLHELLTRLGPRIQRVYRPIKETIQDRSSLAHLKEVEAPSVKSCLV